MAGNHCSSCILGGYGAAANSVLWPCASALSQRASRSRAYCTQSLLPSLKPRGIPSAIALDRPARVCVDRAPANTFLGQVKHQVVVAHRGVSDDETTASLLGATRNTHTQQAATRAHRDATHTHQAATRAHRDASHTQQAATRAHRDATHTQQAATRAHRDATHTHQAATRAHRDASQFAAANRQGHPGTRG